MIPGSGRSPGGGHGNPLQDSCLENPGQRSLAGGSPWDPKESDTTERLSTTAGGFSQSVPAAHPRVLSLHHLQAREPASPLPASLTFHQGRSPDLMCMSVAQSCPALCDPMDCDLPGSSVHGILQARILERAAMPSSRGSSQPRDQTRVSCNAGRSFTV